MVLQRPFDPVPRSPRWSRHAVPGVEAVDAGDGATGGAARAAVRRSSRRPWARTGSSCGPPRGRRTSSRRWPPTGSGSPTTSTPCATRSAATRSSGRSSGRRPRLRILGHPDGFEAAGDDRARPAGVARRGPHVRRPARRRLRQPGPRRPDRLPDRRAARGRRPRRAAGRRPDHPLPRAHAARARPRLRRRARARAGRPPTSGPGSWPCPGSARGPSTTSRCACSGDRDAMPVGDLVLRRALDAGSAADVTRVAERWRPLRAFAALHLWTATAYLL